MGLMISHSIAIPCMLCSYLLYSINYKQQSYIINLIRKYQNLPTLEECIHHGNIVSNVIFKNAPNAEIKKYSPSRFIQAINECQIINLSSSILFSEDANKISESKCAFVIAAGNCGENILSDYDGKKDFGAKDFPLNILKLKNIVLVGAYDNEDETVSVYSNYLSANSEDLNFVYANGDTVYQNGETEEMQHGTSISAAFVSGELAKIKEEFPSSEGEDLIKILISRTKKPRWYSYAKSHEKCIQDTLSFLEKNINSDDPLILGEFLQCYSQSEIYIDPNSKLSLLSEMFNEYLRIYESRPGIGRDMDIFVMAKIGLRKIMIDLEIDLKQYFPIYGEYSPFCNDYLLIKRMNQARELNLQFV